MNDAIEEANSERQGPPWENPDAGAFHRRIWDTFLQAVKTPTEFFQDMRLSGGLLSPLAFYVLVILSATVIGQVFESLLWSVFGSVFLMGVSQDASIGAMFLGVQGASFLITLVLLLLLFPFVLAAALFIGSGLTHLSLKVFGGAKQPFEATFRVNAYAYGSVGWVAAVPFCGSMVAGVWGIVLEILGIARVHQVSTGMAVAAVLVPIAIIFILFMCLAAAVVAVVGLIEAGY